MVKTMKIKEHYFNDISGINVLSTAHWHKATTELPDDHLDSDNNISGVYTALYPYDTHFYGNVNDDRDAYYGYSNGSEVSDIALNRVSQ